MKTALLIILDGFGLNPDRKHNAVAQAQAPTLHQLMNDFPHGALEASEDHVGLPAGFMGNSEVGHLNIGAGRVVYQDFSLISKAIQDKSFFKNPAFLDLFKKKGPEGALHLMGLVSDGGVHSHISHLFALLELAKQQKIEKVWIHAFTDGRDTSPSSGRQFIDQLEKFCQDKGVGKIGTISGRFYAMDRDKRWERTEEAFEALVHAKAKKNFKEPVQYMDGSYQEGASDEFVTPAVWAKYPGMKSQDVAIFFNFRADRARQITRKLIDLKPLAGFVAMTPYDASMDLVTAYGKPKVPNTLGEVVSGMGWKQLRIAETEKYAHVTYFFNGGDEKVFDGEKRILIPSPREVRTYDLKPEMSALLITERLIEELTGDDYRLAVVNFANPDMVGHTGNLNAAIKAVETIDHCMKKILDWVEKNDSFALITADHGNCEKMLDDNGIPLTAHTLLPVPFIYFNPKSKDVKVLPGGKLSDIAPTLLTLMGLQVPSEMTGRNLIV